MPLRKAIAYSKKYARPYTRKSRAKKKSYIKTIPPQKIVKFNMGDIKGFGKDKYKYVLKLVSKEKIQIRDNALEAARQVINKQLEDNIPGAYYFAVKVFPHHILRENKVFGGGSKGERVNTGMQQSFGSTLGRAALVEKNKVIFLLAVGSEKNMRFVRKVLKKILSKLPCSTKIVVELRKD